MNLYFSVNLRAIFYKIFRLGFHTLLQRPFLGDALFGGGFAEIDFHLFGAVSPIPPAVGSQFRGSPQREQPAVGDAAPAHFLNGDAIMPGQRAAQTPVEAFVNENAHGRRFRAFSTDRLQ
jgi:hypothetical protein